jgi:hypothetical protein
VPNYPVPTDHADSNVWGPKLNAHLSNHADPLTGYLLRQPVTVTLKVIDDTTTLTTGDGKFFFFITDDIAGFNLTNARAFVTTSSSSGLVNIMIRNATDAVDMLTTPLTIDANESGSNTAITPVVIDTAHDDVVLGDKIEIDIDGAGTGTKGLSVSLTFGP